MATDGRNFLSELFKSAGQGLGEYAAGRQREQAEGKQNALAAFAATMQMQEANRQAEEHRAQMARLAMENRVLELQEQEQARLMTMTPEERATEQGRSEAAKKAAELKSWIDANNVPIGPWNASPAGMAGAIDQSGIFGPGMSGEIGGITFKGADPNAELNRRYKQALIDESNARITQMGDRSDVDKKPSVSERRFIRDERRELALAEANDTFNAAFDPDEMADLGISAITNISDLKKVLKHLQETGGRTKTNSLFGVDFLSADTQNKELEGQLRGWLRVYQGKGYGPDKSFPTMEEYEAAKAEGVVE